MYMLTFEHLVKSYARNVHLSAKKYLCKTMASFFPFYFTHFPFLLDTPVSNLCDLTNYILEPISILIQCNHSTNALTVFWYLPLCSFAHTFFFCPMHRNIFFSNCVFSPLVYIVVLRRIVRHLEKIGVISFLYLVPICLPPFLSFIQKPARVTLWGKTTVFSSLFQSFSFCFFSMFYKSIAMIETFYVQFRFSVRNTIWSNWIHLVK